MYTHACTACEISTKVNCIVGYVHAIFVIRHAWKTHTMTFSLELINSREYTIDTLNNYGKLNSMVAFLVVSQLSQTLDSCRLHMVKIHACTICICMLSNFYIPKTRDIAMSEIHDELPAGGFRG